MSEPWKRALARELAREALFDEGVEAARNACVAGASIAAATITAAAWYDNPLTGLPALRACLCLLAKLPCEVSAWRAALFPRVHPDTGDADFSPGFGYVGSSQGAAILDSCARILQIAGGTLVCPRMAFFLKHERELSATLGPLNHAGLAAITFADRKVAPDSAERIYLLFRTETAIIEAQRARDAGLASMPFFSEEYVYEGSRPPIRAIDSEALLKEVGLE